MKVTHETIIVWFPVFQKKEKNSVKVVIAACESVGIKPKCHKVKAGAPTFLGKVNVGFTFILRLVSHFYKRRNHM